ncbi:MAG: phosphoethanolamine transferase domain-containing protein, partial [Pseudomonadota bacterium]|nr:phosphoethanolamine transferase domain-containing protein [Pseudomonadota bacterium]
MKPVSVSRRSYSPLVLALLCALWLAIVGNLALWQALRALPDLHGARGLGFALAFGLGVLALHGLIFSLLAWRFTLKPVLSLFLLAAAGGTYFMLSYGVVIDRTMMVNVLLTDTREARELLNWRMVAALLLLGALPVALVWRLPLRWPGFWRQLRANALVFAAALALLLGACGLFFQDLSSTMRNHTQLRYLINPLSTFYALGAATLSPAHRGAGPVLPLGQDAHLPARATGAHPPLAIFVVGETARADHMGLNGYSRDTTPQLAQQDVASLRNVWSCGTNTAASLPCMFSPLGREAFVQRSSNTETLADVLQHAGLAVLWIDNQAGGCKGVCARVPRVNFDELQTPDLCDSSGECLDEAMLSGLQARIDALPAERRARGVVVFLHQMGSHGPAYYKRSPASLKPFQPECTTNVLTQCPREEIVNAYDNTIAYTDHFLARTIDWLKTQQTQWAPALVYVSDHGESLGENNLYLHGL